MQLTSRKTIESTAMPGVSFTVRRLSLAERSTRDLQTMDARRKCNALAREWRALLPPMQADGVTFVNPEDDTPEARELRSRLDEEYALMRESIIKPAGIRAALLSITGLSVDEKPITTAKDFLAVCNPALDDLAGEIYQACEEAAWLTDEERKNLQPPTTSSELAAGETTPSTATPVSA